MTVSRTLAMALACVALAACTDGAGAIRAAENAGLKDVVTEGYAMWGCGRDDSFRTRFSATNPQGRRVTGVVCSGWLKGSTVRFD